MLHLTLLLLVASGIRQSTAEVTEKDLEEQLGFDLKDAKNVSWSDWVNGLVTAIPDEEVIFGRCSSSAFGSELIEEKKSNDTGGCDASKNIRCHGGVCICADGYWPINNGTSCGKKNKKELGESCSDDKDDCYAAFANCVNGKCRCTDGFDQVNQVCRPKTYHCPYKRPLTINGKIWPCRVDRNNTCPKYYACLLRPVADSEERARFVTASGVEQAYCCPLLPDIAGARYDDICVYGEPLKLASQSDCPKSTHYRRWGTGVCCPIPCRPQPKRATVIDGKCHYQ